jgi:hypothetical protein
MEVMRMRLREGTLPADIAIDRPGAEIMAHATGAEMVRREASADTDRSPGRQTRVQRGPAADPRVTVLAGVFAAMFAGVFAAMFAGAFAAMFAGAFAAMRAGARFVRRRAVRLVGRGPGGMVHRFGLATMWLGPCVRFPVGRARVALTLRPMHFR